MRPILQVICAAALLAFTSGCSFNRAWARASALPPSPEGITGRWEGSWVSEINQHHGQLRCLLSKDEAGAYQARFHAAFLHVLNASYSVPLRITAEDGTFKLRGEQNLGWLMGGVYSYKGTANATNFFCTYRSKSDLGTFQMTRPQ